MKRLLLLALLAAVLLLFFLLDLDQLMTLQGIQARQQDFSAWRANSPTEVFVAYFVLYVLVTAVSLPGAGILTLGAGALFNFVSACVLVSFASAIGATLAFLLSRYLFRDAVQSRFGNRLDAINQGIARDGNYYLFTLRLIPLFPFFLINLLIALTPMRTLRFYWVSQLGMLPATLVFVNAGAQLAELNSVSEILSPGIIGSFTLLGIFPLLTKRTLEFIDERRFFSRWRKPIGFDRNLIVIGAGAAGLVSAYIAASLKARVTLIESNRMGGDCLNTGCVPSKTLLHSAKLIHQARQGAAYGLEPTELRFDFGKVMQRVRAAIEEIEPNDSIARYTKLGVEVLAGHARLVDPWTVEVTNSDRTRLLTTRSIIIASGAKPFVPPLDGLEAVGYLTSETLWDELQHLEQAPARLLVLGGGPIGCEMAQAFSRLGSEVTLVELQDQLLPREDVEVANTVQAALERDGVEILTGHATLRCVRNDSNNQLIVRTSTGERTLDFDKLLCAAGRVPRLDGYGLEQLGLTVEGQLPTDEYLQTRCPNIYAAGDVIGPFQFTHAASHQAWHAAVNALFGGWKRFRVDYSTVPATVFTDPEIARVGLNEREARRTGVAYQITVHPIDKVDRAIIQGTTDGFVKVLTVPGSDRILGATIVAEHGGEMIAEFVTALKYGLGLKKLLATIHAYPTMTEANKAVAGQWRRANSPQWVMRLLQRYHARKLAIR